MTNQSTDFLPIDGTDFVEFYVGNAKQAAHYYQTAFGFQPLAYRGLETGDKEKTSYVLRQGKITLVLTTPLQPDSEIAEHIKQRGDGVKFVALWVPDAVKSYEETTKRGAKSWSAPEVYSDDNGEVCISGIYTYGETVHLFVDRSKYNGVFLPGFVEWNPQYQPGTTGLKYVDHMVGNVGWNEMNVWAKFYSEVMGFKQIMSFDDKDISTEYSALMSKVMSNGNGRIKFPINEPAEGKRKSQVEEYLDFYGCAGVQHVAMATDDIVKTVRELRSRGVEFLTIPDVYYENLLKRVGTIDEELKTLMDLHILVDRDDEGYLLQIFTKPVEDRPTVFYEIIQRKGATSFGKGNFKALFESIELEQERRGTL
ncbi:4-hydroxyphenylpyruvate dioxygenase [Carboxylicivirga sp. N1Y90]|uniref:4-hydroxyphenylpyruvate dioxygenase n=1 Tax=Carboxylicivirga fragile TaxID=3417571 RepID=UPI003D341A99|nr:4-hydroxyphenylpyruvate dioxygenase [Marinilabiliaceae bacterium N1Y90]